MTRTRSLKRFLAIASLLHPSSVPLDYFRSYARATSPPKWIEIFYHHGRWSESRYLESLVSLKEDGMIQIHSSGNRKFLSLLSAGIQRISELCKTRHYDLVKEASLVVLTHLTAISKGDPSHKINDEHIMECLDHSGSWLLCIDEHNIPAYPAKDIKHALATAQLFVNHDRYLEAERLYSHAIQLTKLDLRRYHSKLTLAVDKLVQIYLDHHSPSQAEQLLDNTWRLLRSKLGPLHLVTLTMVEAMAVYLCGQGRLAAGEQLFRLILNARPAGHRQVALQPDIDGDITARSFDQLTMQMTCGKSLAMETPNLYQESKLVEQRDPIHLPVIWRKWSHDKDTPSMAIMLLSAERNLGLTLIAQGRNAEAWDILSSATRSAMTWLSTTPKIAISCIEALSVCASWKDSDGDALKLCSEAYTLAVARLGAGHSHTEEIYLNLCLALQLRFSKRPNARPG